MRSNELPQSTATAIRKWIQSLACQTRKCTGVQTGVNADFPWRVVLRLWAPPESLPPFALLVFVIVYNLICSRFHQFEGWFGSTGDCERQLAASTLHCPLCNDPVISRLPSAPRITTQSMEKGASPDRTTVSSSPPAANPDRARLIRQFIEQFENVGSRFAEEARSMHYGEKPHCNIRGTVSPHTAAELREEGIEVFFVPPGLPLPDKLN